MIVAAPSAFVMHPQQLIPQMTDAFDHMETHPASVGCPSQAETGQQQGHDDQPSDKGGGR
jgi:hypothetical protein